MKFLNNNTASKDIPFKHCPIAYEACLYQHYRQRDILRVERKKLKEYQKLAKEYDSELS